jgi:hypothetical protein
MKIAFHRDRNHSSVADKISSAASVNFFSKKLEQNIVRYGQAMI